MLHPYLFFDYLNFNRSSFCSITVPIPFAGLFVGGYGKKSCCFLILETARHTYTAGKWDIDRSFWICSEGVKDRD